MCINLSLLPDASQYLSFVIGRLEPKLRSTVGGMAGE
jgi:hypothetical protein